MKANVSEQLRRSPAKGAVAVASILQDVEETHPECKAVRSHKGCEASAVRVAISQYKLVAKRCLSFVVMKVLLWAK